MTQTKAHDHLSLQEKVLASGMLRKVGDATIQFALGADGLRRHGINFTNDDFSRLTREFASDPKESLAWAREGLFAINQDKRLPSTERKERLGRYFEAYTDLTLKLDHAAFPPTAPGEVRRGVPEYIPDGFVDMGGDKAFDKRYRDREQILVDKRQIFEKFSPALEYIFSTDYSKFSHTEKKNRMAAYLAMEVYRALPYDHKNKYLGGDKVPLSGFDEGVCRHQALVFQVLAQAVGLKSLVIKSHMDGGRHAMNMVRLDSQWHLVDVTNPDYVPRPDGQTEWRPGSYKIDRPPRAGETRRYQVRQRHSGKEHTYVAHDDMYWHIDTPPSIR